VPSPDDYGVRQLVQVYYDELDAMGVLYYGRYATPCHRTTLRAGPPPARSVPDQLTRARTREDPNGGVRVP
jgi:hypothetical protein